MNGRAVFGCPRRDKSSVRPADDILQSVHAAIDARAERRRKYAALRDLPPVTRDQARIGLHMNAGLLIDMQHLDETGADVLIVETDSVKGPVFERNLKVIGSTRGDPNNVDIPAATAAGLRGRGAPPPAETRVHPGAAAAGHRHPRGRGRDSPSHDAQRAGARGPRGRQRVGHGAGGRRVAELLRRGRRGVYRSDISRSPFVADAISSTVVMPASGTAYRMRIVPPPAQLP